MKIELHEISIQKVVRYSKHLRECQGKKAKIDDFKLHELGICEWK